ncbi:MAG: S-adenosylmethionine:tRNA ribosyltransferase-isomerase [Bacteroidales bacterium]|jgi:S-adenosylmethionine:tRNA ribosyltransferase-isomerase|nr:S-adenosylmethionine:tRNA ribosyltransferase-isomerase [Bacteroidales bacterium]
MKNIPTFDELKIGDFDYPLPDSCIAKYPLQERDRSKLLLFRNGRISEDVFAHLPDYIDKDDMLIFNNTRVIKARIEMEKETGARIEIFCLEPYDPADYQLSFLQKEQCRWKCLVGNKKKWKSGSLKKEISVSGEKILFQAEKTDETERYTVIRFRWNGEKDFGSVLDSLGQTPVPPYLNRKSEIIDEIRYQTVYSKHKGSVAAPTAGLHFSPPVLQRLTEQGCRLEEITLHVGAGTFKPIHHEDVQQHEMHVEFFTVHVDLLRKILALKEAPTAVGTTSLRALESIYWLGVKSLHQAVSVRHLALNQWEAYHLPQNIGRHEALSCLIREADKEGIRILHAATQIMIVPGYKFRICRRLITNFHQPKSTLLLLVSAFTNNRWEKIYRYALNNNFRFLSYGDSSLLEYQEQEQRTAQVR